MNNWNMNKSLTFLYHQVLFSAAFNHFPCVHSYQSTGAFVSEFLLLGCILSSFLGVHFPPSLPYDLYRPLCSHPSCPFPHTDSGSVSRKGSVSAVTVRWCLKNMPFSGLFCFFSLSLSHLTILKEKPATHVPGFKDFM